MAVAELVFLKRQVFSLPIPGNRRSRYDPVRAKWGSGLGLPVCAVSGRKTALSDRERGLTSQTEERQARSRTTAPEISSWKYEHTGANSEKTSNHEAENAQAEPNKDRRLTFERGGSFNQTHGKYIHGFVSGQNCTSNDFHPLNVR